MIALTEAQIKLLRALRDWASPESMRRRPNGSAFMPLHGAENQTAARLMDRPVWLVDVRSGGYAKITPAGLVALASALAVPDYKAACYAFDVVHRGVKANKPEAEIVADGIAALERASAANLARTKAAKAPTPRMDEEHEQGIRDALRAWLRVQVGPVTKEDRSQMLEQMRAKAFQVFGPAREAGRTNRERTIARAAAIAVFARGTK